MQEKRVSFITLYIIITVGKISLLFPKKYLWKGVGDDFSVIIGRQTESIPHSVSHY